MLTVYAFATPNSIKVPILLEELELDYQLKSVNVRNGEQKSSHFLQLNAHGKVPVLVENTDATEPHVISESAAILLYLAEKHRRFLPASLSQRARVYEQLFFHASGLSPAYGQSGYFQRLASEPNPLAIERFSNEARRVTRLLDEQLSRQPYVAGHEFSIADIAHFGWVWRHEFAGIDIADYPAIKRWYAELVSRPAFERAIKRVTALVSEQGVK